MDTRAFLEAVWPPTGIYCLATPFKPGDADRSTYAHYTAHSIDEFLRKVDALRSKDNVFFCVHTLQQDRVWNPTKKNRQTGALGAWERRTHENMLEARCFFFDLDVGESTATTPKYATRQEALDGLDKFLFRTGLPDPLVTSSGGGYHVYWRLSEAINSVDWRRHATVLHHIARREGLRADPARTNDQSSVLRVVGTQNIKPGREPRQCVAIAEGVETSTGSFLGQLGELLGSDSIAPELLAAARPVGNLAKTWDGPTASVAELRALCAHVEGYCSAIEAGENPAEPEWYHLGCGLLQYTDDGVDAVLEFTKPTRGNDETLAKLDQYNAACGNMPPNCATLDAKCGGDACSKCMHNKLGKNPLLIASELRKKAAAPPPVLNASLVANQPAMIVEPGFPYSRTKRGIVQHVVKKDKEGNETEDDVVICTYDMFPFEQCARTELERAFTAWAVEIPNEGQIVVKITSAMMQDIRGLHATLEDYGVHVNRFQAEKISMFMTHYNKTLQQALKASRQYDHLGWADAAHTEFILPTTILQAGGQSPCTVSGMVSEVARHVHTLGSLSGQLDALRYYNDPKYFKHQFVVLCALAAPAFQASDFYGVVVNAAGESGGGKSSALFAGAGLWGDPKGYVVNGAKLGASLLGQQQKVFTLSNLPYCIDEITHNDDDRVKDFVLSSTQAEEPDKLLPNGQPRPKRQTFKSTMYLCTSNKSFHNLLAQGAEVGNASSMRVFELWFDEFKTGKVEAQENHHKVLTNYGWIGPAALERYLQHRQYVDDCIRTVMSKMDRKFGFSGPERYWSAVYAVALTYGEFAAAYGLIPFDIPALRTWLFEKHLPQMRGHIAEDRESHEAEAVLGAYLNDCQGQTLVTASDVTMSNQLPITDPRGAVVAEYDKIAQQVHIRKDRFRQWLNDKHFNALKVLSDLNASAIVVASGKRTLGAGTNFARARTVCLTIDLTNPAVAGLPQPAAAKPTNVVPLRRRP